jgi:hypothetical protein
MGKPVASASSTTLPGAPAHHTSPWAITTRSERGCAGYLRDHHIVGAFARGDCVEGRRHRFGLGLRYEIPDGARL